MPIGSLQCPWCQEYFCVHEFMNMHASMLLHFSHDHGGCIFMLSVHVMFMSCSCHAHVLFMSCSCLGHVIFMSCSCHVHGVFPAWQATACMCFILWSPFWQDHTQDTNGSHADMQTYIYI